MSSCSSYKAASPFHAVNTILDVNSEKGKREKNRKRKRERMEGERGGEWKGEEWRGEEGRGGARRARRGEERNRDGSLPGSTIYPALPHLFANPLAVSGRRPKPLSTFRGEGDSPRLTSAHPSLRRQASWLLQLPGGPRQHSQPPLSRHRQGPSSLPLKEGQRPLSLCSPPIRSLQSSTHRSWGHPARAGPTPYSWSRWVQLSRPPVQPQHWLGEEGLSWTSDFAAQRRKEGLQGEGRQGAHLPKSVQLKTQTSLRTDTAAAVSLSFE